MPVKNFYEQCVKELKDEKACEEITKAIELLETLKLEDCVKKHNPDKCYNLCMEKCQGNDCERHCGRVIAYAVAANSAREMLTTAAYLAMHTGIILPEAIAVIYIDTLAELERKVHDCKGKLKLTALFSGIAGELVGATGIKELTLLMAPTIATVRDCIEKQGELFEAELNELLEGLKQLVGEEIIARLNAALEEGAIKIGRLVVRFSPLHKA